MFYKNTKQFSKIITKQAYATVDALDKMKKKNGNFQYHLKS